MTAADGIAAALLTAGVATVCLASLGMLLLSSALDRLHCAGLAATCGLGLIAAAALVAHPADQFAIKAALLAVITWCFGPVLAHVQASLAYRVATSDRKRIADQNAETP